MADLTGVRLKVGTALAHLLYLDEQIAVYLDSDPMAIMREVDDRHPGRVILSIVLRTTPPVTLSALIGDCLQNLRASLDHLAAQLVMAHGGTARSGPGGTQFPIVVARPAAALKVAGGVAPEALAVITSVQPFQRRDPENHPLAILNQLSNMDKHRTSCCR